MRVSLCILCSKETLTYVKSSYELDIVQFLRLTEKFPKSVSKLVLADDEMRSVFAPNGTLLRLGEIVKMPKLSRTLELIAQNGSEAMYGGGWLTETMVKEINAKGGVFRKEDIQNYDIKVRGGLKS